MSAREQFEEWFDREYPVDENGSRKKYRETMVMDLMLASWQAARQAALEEAAKLMNPCDDEETLGAMNAESIRTLKEQA